MVAAALEVLVNWLLLRRDTISRCCKRSPGGEAAAWTKRRRARWRRWRILSLVLRWCIGDVAWPHTIGVGMKSIPQKTRIESWLRVMYPDYGVLIPKPAGILITTS